MILLPPPELRALVRYFVIQSPENGLTQMPATAAPSLVVFVRGASRLVEPEGPRMPAAFLCGPALTPRLSLAELGSEFLSVLFRPGALPVFFGVHVAALTGAQWALRDLVGAEADQLVGGVRAARGPLRMVAALSRFLLEQAARRSAAAPPRIPGSMLQGPLRSVAPALGYTERTLQRLCAAHYGLAPRDLRRVVRFERSLAGLLLAPGGLNLAQLAHAVGYFDHAHFDRHFRAFCGHAPSEFLRRLAGAAPELWPYRFQVEELRRMIECPQDVAWVQDL